MKLALTPAAPWSDNGYGLVEQRQHRRPDRAGQRVESVHGVQAADIADGALAITGSLVDGVAQTPELVRLAEHAASITVLQIGLVCADLWSFPSPHGGG